MFPPLPPSGRCNYGSLWEVAGLWDWGWHSASPVGGCLELGDSNKGVGVFGGLRTSPTPPHKRGQSQEVPVVGRKVVLLNDLFLLLLLWKCKATFLLPFKGNFCIW